MALTRLAGAIALALALASPALATCPDDWQADPYCDPDHGPLAAARDTTHPIDQMVRLASVHGIEAAALTLAEWEADPAWHDRLHQRPAYRQWAQQRAQGRIGRRMAALDAATPAPERTRRPQAAQTPAAEVAQSPRPAPTATRTTTPPATGAHTRSRPIRTQAQTQAQTQPAPVASPPAAAPAPPAQGAAASEPAQVAATAQPRTAPAVDYAQELRALRGQVRSLTTQRDELAARLSELEIAHAQLRAEHEALVSRHEVLGQEYARLARAHEALEIAHAEVVDERDGLRAENQRLVAEGARLEKRYELALEEVSRLNEAASLTGAPSVADSRRAGRIGAGWFAVARRVQITCLFRRVWL